MSNSTVANQKMAAAATIVFAAAHRAPAGAPTNAQLLQVSNDAKAADLARHHGELHIPKQRSGGRVLDKPQNPPSTRVYVNRELRPTGDKLAELQKTTAAGIELRKAQAAPSAPNATKGSPAKVATPGAKMRAPREAATTTPAPLSTTPGATASPSGAASAQSPAVVTTTPSCETLVAAAESKVHMACDKGRRGLVDPEYTVDTGPRPVPAPDKPAHFGCVKENLALAEVKLACTTPPSPTSGAASTSDASSTGSASTAAATPVATSTPSTGPQSPCDGEAGAWQAAKDACVPGHEQECHEAIGHAREVSRACTDAIFESPSTATTTLVATSTPRPSTAAPTLEATSTQSTARVTHEPTCEEKAKAAMDSAFEACVFRDPACDSLLSVARAQADECQGQQVSETPTAAPKPSVNGARILGSVLGAILGVLGVAGGIAYVQNRNPGEQGQAAAGEPGQPVASANGAPVEAPPAYTAQVPANGAPVEAPPAYAPPAYTVQAPTNGAPAAVVALAHVVVNVGDAAIAEAHV